MQLYFFGICAKFHPQKRRLAKSTKRRGKFLLRPHPIRIQPHVTHDLHRIANNCHVTHPFSFPLPSCLPPYTDFRCPSQKKEKKRKKKPLLDYLYYNSAQSLPLSPLHSKMVLLNGPPLSNFVDRGPGRVGVAGAWEYQNYHFVCNTPKNLPTLVLAPSLFPHSLNYPPFLSSVPLSHTLTVITCFSRGLHSGLRPRAPTS